MKHRTIWIVMLLSLVASTMPAFAELTCSKCGKKYDDRSRYSFCTADGAPLKGDNNQAVAGSMEIKDAMICPVCGTIYAVGSRLCSKDGSVLYDSQTLVKDAQVAAEATRLKAYEILAQSDLRNAKTCCEAYFADNMRYPDALDEAMFKPSKNVTVTYTRVGSDNYMIVSKHDLGSKWYRTTSTSPSVDVLAEAPPPVQVAAASEPSPSTNPPAAPPRKKKKARKAPEHAAAPATDNDETTLGALLTGSVTSVTTTGGYAYLEVADGSGRRTWLAVPEVPVSEGEIIEYQRTPPLRNFQSKSLNRTFGEIMFVPGIRLVK